jgi:hypothetical protein
MERAMIKRRRRFNQNLSFRDRLKAWANEVRERASKLAAGSEKEALLRKANQAEVAALDDWANSPGLQPPK